MSDKGLMVRGSTDLRTARAEIPWIKEKDIDEVEEKEPLTAGALSLALPGAGHAYNHDWKKGIGIAAAAIATLVFVPYGIVPYLGAGIASYVLAYRQSKKVNRYIRARWREQQHPEKQGNATRLLARMSKPGAPTPSAKTTPADAEIVPDDPLVQSLRKLATLHRNGMITDLEYSDRKIDVLTETATALPRDQLDDLLFALLPLRNEGSLDDSDIEFIKNLSP